MKTVEGSSHGRGGRGRGRGGNFVSRGSGGQSRGGYDSRFDHRRNDPRFAVTSGSQNRNNFRGRGGGRGRDRTPIGEEAMLSDPRFAKHIRSSHVDEEVIQPQDEDEEENEDSDAIEESLDEEADVEDLEVDEEEQAILDEDAAGWSGSDIDICEATKRVAIVNCDWDHVRAVDLYAIIFHALPLGGQVKDVKIYLSDFGKKMQEHERIHGPDLWVKPGEDEPSTVGAAEGSEMEVQEVEDVADDFLDAEDDPDADNGEEGDDGWVEDDTAMLTEVGEDGEMFSGGKHRKYERERMKYYYAVATFDSADTAASVYHDLDGMDIEASGVCLDLRYIDDDETFDDAPVQTCNKLPPNFKPLAAFKSAANTQTKFRISWDQDDVLRHQSIKDVFTGTTEEDDLAAYIATDSSDDENDPAYELKKKKRDAKRLAIRKKYAELLADIGGLPDELPEEQKRDGEEEDASNQSGSDDDDLNRLSDVDFGDESSDEEVTGNVEGTIDFDADTKAQRLQRDLQIQKQFKDADVGTKAQLKYKLKRKENKAAKRDMLQEEREAERAAIREQQFAHRQNLRESLGDVLEGERGEKLSGKQKRKEHAKVKKEQVAKEREEKKKQRLAGSLGITSDQLERASAKETAPAADAIDSRFKGKLLSDPRFHLDIAQKDKRANQDVVKLASTVIKARQERSKNASITQPATKTGRDDDVVDYFLSRPQKKARTGK